MLSQVGAGAGTGGSDGYQRACAIVVPTTATGKVQKFLLRELARDGG